MGNSRLFPRLLEFAAADIAGLHLVDTGLGATLQYGHLIRPRRGGVTQFDIPSVKKPPDCGGFLQDFLSSCSSLCFNQLKDSML